MLVVGSQEDIIENKQGRTAKNQATTSGPRKMILALAQMITDKPGSTAATEVPPQNMPNRGE
jgi:hypothetical protein